MESMILGSPSSPSSPSSPDVQGRMQQSKQTFIQPFLFGSSQQPKSTTQVGSETPLRSGHRVSWSPDLVQTNRQQQRSTFVNVSQTQPFARADLRFCGPPIRSLSTEVDANIAASTFTNQNVSYVEASSYVEPVDTSISSSFVPSGQRSLSSSANELFYSKSGTGGISEECLDDCCVTVFGFPPQSASHILQEFSQYGTVVKYQISNNGNWMHLRYQTKLQAKKALSKNAKIFNHSVQVGVTPCNDKDVIDLLRSEFTDVTQSDISTSKRLQETNLVFAANQNSFVSDHSRNESALSSKPNESRKSMRSLTAAYTSPIKANNDNVETKTDGLVNKAWQYVFGW